MANILTNLAADIYTAADTVGRELVGVIPSVTLNTDAAQRVAVGDTIRSHFTGAASVGTFTAAMTIPEGTDQTVDNKTMSISNTASVKIPWTGEDVKHVNNGSGFETIYGDQIAQAMRAITNQIESEAAADIYKNSSRAYGTAGTTPFASSFAEIPQMRKILADNGTPFDGRNSIILNTTAGANLRTLASLSGVNTSGNDILLRQGTLLDLQGFMLKESAGIASVGASTITANVTVTGANAVGTTTINVTTDGTGAVSIPAGGVITFAGDTNKYVVTTAVTIGSSTTGDIEIQAPGLLQATSGSEAVSGTAAYDANLALHSSAAEVAMRPIAMPQGGDSAVDIMMVQDPYSGLVFEVAAYKGYGKAMFDVRCAYGYKTWKPEFVATLLG